MTITGAESVGTKIALELQKAGVDLLEIPVTVDEAAQGLIRFMDR